MCGILGGNKFNDIQEVKAGLASIMHRGTDGNIIFHFEKHKFYMCHNRLSIQDLSEAANQPLISEDEKFVLAFNGEMWKPFFRKFNSKLRKKYNFKTERSDSELLLYYLIENRDNIQKAMNKLDGMFCFAFYDVDRNELTLGRDFIGRLPLYYVFEDSQVVFSSEVKGIQSAKPEYKFFNVDRSRKPPKGQEEKIKVVEPGTIVTVSKNLIGVTNCEVKRWNDFKPEFNPENPTLYTRSETDLKLFEGEDKGIDYYASEFRKRLEKAVDDELISDTPICTILSGGIDSTIITYLLKKKNPDIEAFVVNVTSNRKQTLKDDLYYAKIAAKELGVRLHEVNVSKDDIENNLKESIWASETHKWTQVSPAVAQLFLSWEIRDKGYKVVFGGEGADEIFASYGDVKRFCWPDPLAWHQKRVNLINNLHKNNLIRTNKAMMYGGKVELRTPFLNKEVIDFGLRIPTRYRDEADGKGNIMKYVLRKAFEGEISEELLWRPKKTFQQGCHTDYLKKEQETIDKYFNELFVENKVPQKYLDRNLGHISARIKVESVG
jgi:asparagine synthase (glutamine-hydrolysing)